MLNILKYYCPYGRALSDMENKRTCNWKYYSYKNVF